MNNYDTAAKILGIIRATLSEAMSPDELDRLNNIVYEALEKDEQSFNYYYSAQVLSTQGLQWVSDYVVCNQKLNQAVIECICSMIVEDVNKALDDDVCNTDDVHIHIIKELDE